MENHRYTMKMNIVLRCSFVAIDFVFVHMERHETCAYLHEPDREGDMSDSVCVCVRVIW